MKFTNIALLAFAAAAVSAAPTSEGSEFLLPSDSIVSTFPIPEEIEPLAIVVDGQKIVVLVNSTLADDTGINKRDAAPGGFVKFRLFEPIGKRDAAPGGFVKFRLFEPIGKRDAAPGGFVKFRLFEPIGKRDAAPGGFVKFRLFEPIG